MFRTALATNVFMAGLAVLVPLMPTGAMAQLPDAPSAVIAAQRLADALASSGADRRVSRDDASVGAIPAFSTSAENVIDEFAMNAEPVVADQQSVYRPPRNRNSGPGFSSSISDTRAIPGAAPVLRNTCPHDACSPAEDIMCCGTAPPPFARYLKNPDTVPLTARDNLHSAVIGVVDPFNLLTIAADAAIGVASDSHSPYGPGFDGFAKYAGVSVTEDITGEFFGTFLFPSLMHQDPHYHRQPFMPVKRRILHAVTQVVWAQSYTGKPMFNYGNIVGGIATAVVSNTFVPGPGRQGFFNTAQRLGIAFAISPTGNLIEEFVPDVASRINLRVVIFQRILNTVSLEESGVSSVP